jgi:deazaflavin-dependent oxidoreductase (nitroreductase family)
MTAAEAIIAEFRANHGRVPSNERLVHLQMVLITHTGAKSGKRYTTPLGVLVDDDVGFVIAATAAASPRHPDWYYNLLANPRVTVEFADQTFEADARVTEGDERRQLFAAMAEQIPIFKKYERTTPREIPVIVLERVDDLVEES